MTCVLNSIKWGAVSNSLMTGCASYLRLLKQYEDDTGSEVELDVIGLCCEYSEDTPEEIAQNYGIDLEDDGNQLNNVLDYLHDHTMVCGVTKDGSIVYQSILIRG
jgi:hypothetical protein